MKKRDFLKALILEAVKRNLAEMPQIQKFYTLTDNWREAAQTLSQTGPGQKIKNMVTKLEKVEDINHFNRDDIMKAFSVARPQGANALIKLMLDGGVIMPLGKSLSLKQLDIDPDDEFTVLDAPESDLTQGIDLTQALRKIKIEDAVTFIDIDITETYTMEFPDSVKRELEQEYGSFERGLNKKYGIWGSEVSKSYTLRTNRYKFLKPFLEKKHYLRVPSEEPVIISKRSRYWDSPKITDLFPTSEDFFKFVKDNPQSFKMKEGWGNHFFENEKKEVEEAGGKLVLTKVEGRIRS